MTTRLVILAAGRGTRMRDPAPGVELAPRQRRMADRGLKGLVPFHGHPYLSYGMTAAADAGFERICLVVPPGERMTGAAGEPAADGTGEPAAGGTGEPAVGAADERARHARGTGPRRGPAHPIREYYETLETERVEISFAVQERATGSAHAVLAAERFAGDGEFVVINSDNVYTVAALAAVRRTRGGALAGYDPDALVRRSNVPAERVAAFALVTADDEGFLDGVVEKPDAETARRLAGRGRVSMTLWRFRPSIFDACRAIGPSERGEYELGDAVEHAVRALGERFRVVPVDEPVLDLSRREDIPRVAAHLRGQRVRL